jgi:hypothetical protein
VNEDATPVQLSDIGIDIVRQSAAALLPSFAESGAVPMMLVDSRPVVLLVASSLMFSLLTMETSGGKRSR